MSHLENVAFPSYFSKEIFTRLPFFVIPLVFIAGSSLIFLLMSRTLFKLRRRQTDLFGVFSVLGKSVIDEEIQNTESSLKDFTQTICDDSVPVIRKRIDIYYGVRLAFVCLAAIFTATLFLLSVKGAEDVKNLAFAVNSIGRYSSIHSGTVKTITLLQEIRLNDTISWIKPLDVQAALQTSYDNLNMIFVEISEEMALDKNSHPYFTDIQTIARCMSSVVEDCTASRYNSTIGYTQSALEYGIWNLQTLVMLKLVLVVAGIQNQQPLSTFNNELEFLSKIPSGDFRDGWKELIFTALDDEITRGEQSGFFALSMQIAGSILVFICCIIMQRISYYLKVLDICGVETLARTTRKIRDCDGFAGKINSLMKSSRNISLYERFANLTRDPKLFDVL